MFTVPIIDIKVNDWGRKKKLLMNLYSQEKMERVDNKSSDEHLYTSFFSNNYQKDAVYEVIKDELIVCASELNFIEFTLSNVWFQKYNNRDYHSIHTHGALGYSFICFVNFDPNHHDSTTFIAPYLNFLSGHSLAYIPKVKEGTMLFFPSSIMHYAPHNTTDIPRIILSGNISVHKWN